MREIREERGLVYYAACSADVWEDCGQFVIEASTSPKQLDEVAHRALVLQELHAQPAVDAARRVRLLPPLHHAAQLEGALLLQEREFQRDGIADLVVEVPRDHETAVAVAGDELLQKAGAVPERHVYWPDRLPWIRNDQGLPCHVEGANSARVADGGEAR